jgi:hypothetical protein
MHVYAWLMGVGRQHDRLSVERRIAEAQMQPAAAAVKTSDVARLMELFQARRAPRSRHPPH